MPKGDSTSVFETSKKMTRSPIKKNLNTTMSGLCQVCSVEVAYAKLVQCDGCDQWYHFSCVGVNDSVSEQAWICAKCSKVSEEINNATKSIKSKASSKGGFKCD